MQSFEKDLGFAPQTLFRCLRSIKDTILFYSTLRVHFNHATLNTNAGSAGLLTCYPSTRWKGLTGFFLQR